MKLSNYCTIERHGSVWIEISNGRKFPCTLHGMTSDYAQIFIRRLSKKRCLNDENKLMEAEVKVPDMAMQKIIVDTIKIAEKLYMTTSGVSSVYCELHQMTGDLFYHTMGRYYSNLLGELNDHHIMLIDQLMGV